MTPPPKPGFPMIPFFGIEPVLMSDDVRSYIQFVTIMEPFIITICPFVTTYGSIHLFSTFTFRGKEIQGSNVTGNLCIRRPWPSMARTIYGDHEKYIGHLLSQNIQVLMNN